MRISVTSIAPVASVLASSAMATLPPASRSPMMPEPTTAASRNAVPSASAAMRRAGVMSSSRERSRLAGFRSANKRAHKFAFDLWSDCVHIDALPVQKSSRVLDVVNARRLNLDAVKTSLRELGHVFIVLKAPAMQPTHSSIFCRTSGRHFAARDHIGNREAATRLQNPERLAQAPGLCRRKD